ncbi:MAG: protein kinase, partial [Bacillota bacterium]|nr:protein kinase [Bacillota bacterium]
MGHSLIGTVLSHKYELIELIGTGGMAEVYKAKDIRLGRNVAVKVLKQEFNNDKEFIKRFQTESKAIASLSHANIVNVYDVGFEDDLNYIVMELVTGNTLKDYLESIPGFMKEEAVINIAIQICSALSQAHSKQVVHRDVKAQNILIDIDGRIKVADFGIARAASNQ